MTISDARLTELAAYQQKKRELRRMEIECDALQDTLARVWALVKRHPGPVSPDALTAALTGGRP